jgi:hypothetical protein
MLQNWNFNSEEGGAARSINFFEREFDNGMASVDCVSCFARFKAALSVKFDISVGWKGVKATFLAEISISAVANVDVKFSFNYDYEYEYKKKLASITPMLNQNLQTFKILGLGSHPLGVTYGLDISIGVKFEAKANFDMTVGADFQCNFKFGVYYNIKPSSKGNGCTHSFHKPSGEFLTGSVQVKRHLNRKHVLKACKPHLRSYSSSHTFFSSLS